MGAGEVVKISLDGVRDKNVMQLKKLNTALFPIRYKDKYYSDAISSADFSKLAYYSDICVGAIACRLEKKEGGAICVYIMTLGVLAPYRGLGIGLCNMGCMGLCVMLLLGSQWYPVYQLLYPATPVYGPVNWYTGNNIYGNIGSKLLNHVLDLSAKQNISEIYLHVQTNNDDAIAFYKKFGFEITETIQNYYTNITPPDCYVVTKVISQICFETSWGQRMWEKGRQRTEAAGRGVVPARLVVSRPPQPRRNQLASFRVSPSATTSMFLPSATTSVPAIVLA